MADVPSEPDHPHAFLERRLATILAADVAGYSKMMGQNEEATVQTLRAHRAVYDALLKQHHGRVFNTAGDAILAEFPSAVEAVRCATEIQSALRTRNEHLPPEQRMLFRMGINLGDVVGQDGDLLGDGVNVAARIQTIAEPGGICISGSVYDQIQNKLSLQFKRLGDKNLKNIDQPVRTFTITQSESGVLPTASSGPRVSMTLIIAGVVAVAIAAGGYALYRASESRRIEQEALAAQLAAEKKLAEEARRQADEQTRRASQAEEKAERERLVAEAAKREADLQAQAQRADDARRRAEEQGKRLTDENQRLAAKAASESPVLAAGTSPADGSKKGRAATSGAAAPSPANPPSVKTTGRNPFDGTYDGRLCNTPADTSKRRVCWTVALNLENGSGTATWMNRALGKPSSLHANARPDGTVTATMDAWKLSDGTPLAGSMTGRLADNHLDLDGRWANGMHVEGHWTRTP